MLNYFAMLLETAFINNLNPVRQILAGLFFQGKEAEEWLAKGFSILRKELPEQILSDGGNFERSPMYHSIILEDILDLITLLHNYQHPAISAGRVSLWMEYAQKMLYWLHAMIHKDKKNSLFNDAAFNIAPNVDQLDSYAATTNIPIPDIASEEVKI